MNSTFGRELADSLTATRSLTETQPGSPEAIRQVGEGLLWYLATCARCEPDLAQPFRSEDERDDWAAGHVRDTGHAVKLCVAGLEPLSELHMAGVISRDESRQFRYVCPASTCSVSNGPYPSPQLAIASWRTHKPAAMSK